MIFKRTKIVLYTFSILAIALVALVSITDSNYVYKTLWYNIPNTDDYSIFHNNPIDKGQTKPFIIERQKQFQLSKATENRLNELQTLAVMAMRNDTVIYETYWEGHTANDISGSFSVAKTIIGTLIGIAIQDGYIKSVNQPVSDFLPEFKKDERNKITIEHLLTMSSGLDWDEGYQSLISPTSAAYYGEDLEKLIYALKVKEEPGKIYRYKSCDTQILAFVLKKASGKSIASYLSEKIWIPMGMEKEALWSLDKNNGNEKAYCCLNACARDFLRLGKFLLDSGKINQKFVIDSAYFCQMTKVQENLIDGDSSVNGTANWFYGYQTWIIPEYRGKKIIYARGILGQYIIIVPEEKLVIVRLGKVRGKKIKKHYEEMYMLLDEFIKNVG